MRDNKGADLPTIEHTIEYIKLAHDGQMTKGGEPYWTHPVAVMNLLPPDASEDERHAALLHDVIEDTHLTADDLRRAGYSERTTTLVQMLSRPDGEARPSYMEWIKAIAASGDTGLIRIKLADNMHNSDPARIAQLPDGERTIVNRYERSMAVLRQALST